MEGPEWEGRERRDDAKFYDIMAWNFSKLITAIKS